MNWRRLAYAQHPAVRTEVSHLLVGGAILASFVRLIVWLYSQFLIGPVFGVLDALLWNWSRSVYGPFVVIEVIFGIGLVGCAIVVGDREDRRGQWLTRAVRLLGVVFILDTLVYLGPILILAPFRMEGVNAIGWAVLALTVLGNLALGVISVAVVIRCLRRTP